MVHTRIFSLSSFLRHFVRPNEHTRLCRLKHLILKGLKYSSFAFYKLFGAIIGPKDVEVCISMGGSVHKLSG